MRIFFHVKATGICDKREKNKINIIFYGFSEAWNENLIILFLWIILNMEIWVTFEKHRKDNIFLNFEVLNGEYFIVVYFKLLISFEYKTTKYSDW